MTREAHRTKEYECDGKVSFLSYTLAREAAGRRARRSVYHCVFCRKWHVGNSGAPGAKPRLRELIE